MLNLRHFGQNDEKTRTDHQKHNDKDKGEDSILQCFKKLCFETLTNFRSTSYFGSNYDKRISQTLQ